MSTVLTAVHPATRMRPRLLDLFCCAGGAAMGYHQAGFEVVGVDVKPQPRYPFEFIRADALDVLADHTFLSTFHTVHASPPCQDKSSLTKGNRRRPGWTDRHIDLIPQTRAALLATGLPFVIENVQGAELRPDLILCGLMFGLSVFRHRLFELGRWTMLTPAHPSHRGHRVSGWRHGVRHDGDMVAVYGDGGGKGSIQQWQEAMGIRHTDVKTELAEAIPPAYTRLIGTKLIAQVERLTR